MKPSTKTLLVRTLSGAVYVAVIIAALYIDQWLHLSFVCSLVFAALTLIGMREVYRNLALKGIVTNPYLGYASGLLCFFAAVDGSYLWLLIAFAFLCMAQLFRHDEHPFETIGYTLLPVLWVAMPLSLIPIMVIQGASPHYALLVFVLIWINDTFAYLCGITFGKHKMSPRHSPNKTWEGTLGGALFCIVAALFLGNYVQTGEWTLTSVSPYWLPMGAIIAAVGTLGDLVESMFKRYVGVKDSGKLIPGHGGLLDRFDSLLMVLPFAFLYLSAFFL